MFSFDSATPGRPFNVRQITGVTNDSLKAIALRPSNNRLYALSANGIYTLDPMTSSAVWGAKQLTPYQNAR